MNSYHELRFSFRLLEGRIIDSVDNDSLIQHEDINIKLIKTDGDDRRYSVVVWPFISEEIAESFIPSIYTTLRWLTVKYDLHIDFVLEKGARSYCINIISPPDSNNSASLTGKPAIVSTFAPKDPFICGVGVEPVLRSISEILNFNCASTVFEDPKLTTALDLYNTHIQEPSLKSKFLILNMCIEALLSKSWKSEYIQRQLDKYVKDVMKKADAVKGHNEKKHEELRQLSTGLNSLKHSSISQRLKKLILEAMADDPEVNDKIKLMRKLYKNRSDLVHKGVLPEDELVKSISELKEIVVQVLKYKIIASSITADHPVVAEPPVERKVSQ